MAALAQHDVREDPGLVGAENICDAIRWEELADVGIRESCFLRRREF